MIAPMYLFVILLHYQLIIFRDINGKPFSAILMRQRRRDPQITDKQLYCEEPLDFQQIAEVRQPKSLVQ